MTATKTHDIALGVAKGQNPQEVLKAYRRTTASKEQIKNLKPGDTLYMAGYPEYQPVNWTGNQERQMFAMSIIGPTTVRFGTDKTVKVIAAAMPTDEQGAICSPEASGSEGFIEVKGKKLSIGPLYGFTDLDGQVPLAPKQFTGVSKYLPVDRSTKTTAFCYFSYDLGTPSHDDAVIKTVGSTAEIPGYDEMQEFSKTSVSEFRDPDHTKTFLNGIVGIPTDGDKTFWINNPVIFHDAKSDTTLFGYAAKPGDIYEHHMNFVAYKNDQLPQIDIYPHNGAGLVELQSLTGLPRHEVDSSKQTNGVFVVEGEKLGGKLVHTPKTTGGVLKFSAANQGKLSIVQEAIGE